MSRTPRPYSYPKKRCQGLEVLLCTCYLAVLYLPAGIAHNPRTTDNRASHLAVPITEVWGRFGIPTLQGAALAPLCFVPQRHRAVHAQILPQLLAQEPRNPPAHPNPLSKEKLGLREQVLALVSALGH